MVEYEGRYAGFQECEVRGQPQDQLQGCVSPPRLMLRDTAHEQDNGTLVDAAPFPWRATSRCGRTAGTRRMLRPASHPPFRGPAILCMGQVSVRAASHMAEYVLLDFRIRRADARPIKSRVMR